jgi:hypothetical protein
MKGFSSASILIALSVQGCATAPAQHYINFPSLAQRVLSGDENALREVLAKARTTQPGEQLEELAEISSKFVRINPTAFLRVQSTTEGCFGVDFMGLDYVDDQAATLKENALRYNALNGVSDPALNGIKERCLAWLD